MEKDLDTLKNIPVSGIMDSFEGFIKTGVMMHGVEVDIFSKIEEYGPPVSSAKLASELKVSQKQMERYLNACVHMELLAQSQNASGEACYTNTIEAKTYLTKQSSVNIIPMVKNGKYLVPNFSIKMLPETPPPEPEATNARGFYGMLSSARPMMKDFQDGMTSGVKLSQLLLQELDFTGYESVVDLGGGTGYLAQYVKSKNSSATVTLAEMPSVIQLAKEDKTLDTLGIKLHESDFFNASSLPAADLYILARVLHNWSDANCHVILQNIRGVLQGPNKHILILDKHLSPEKTQGPVMADMMIMNMAGEGGERSGAEIKQLLESQGFKVERVVTDPHSIFHDAVLAAKV